MGPSCSWELEPICLLSAVVGRERPPVDPPKLICLDVPCTYDDLRQVFSKDRAQSLPPHRPYDCAIDLLPNAPLLGSWLYQVSQPEQEALWEYISTSLATGLIRPSKTAAGSGFFFIEKKDKSLRPCVDYRDLNDITIKNNTLTISDHFTKLNLRSAYHLVRICKGDEWKTAFKTDISNI